MVRVNLSAFFFAMTSIFLALKGPVVAGFVASSRRGAALLARGGGSRSPAFVTARSMASTMTSGCPFVSTEPIKYPGLPDPALQKEYAAALEKVDWAQVKEDVRAVLTDSKEFWPADYGHYGGLFIRLAWHATGTYRMRYVVTVSYE